MSLAVELQDLMNEQHSVHTQFWDTEFVHMIELLDTFHSYYWLHYSPVLLNIHNPNHIELNLMK